MSEMSENSLKVEINNESLCVSEEPILNSNNHSSTLFPV